MTEGKLETVLTSVVAVLGVVGVILEVVESQNQQDAAGCNAVTTLDECQAKYISCQLTQGILLEYCTETTPVYILLLAIAMLSVPFLLCFAGCFVSRCDCKKLIKLYICNVCCWCNCAFKYRNRRQVLWFLEGVVWTLEIGLLGQLMYRSRAMLNFDCGILSESTCESAEFEVCKVETSIDPYCYYGDCTQDICVGRLEHQNQIKHLSNFFLMEFILMILIATLPVIFACLRKTVFRCFLRTKFKSAWPIFAWSPVHEYYLGCCVQLHTKLTFHEMKKLPEFKNLLALRMKELREHFVILFVDFPLTISTLVFWIKTDELDEHLRSLSLIIFVMSLLNLALGWLGWWYDWHKKHKPDHESDDALELQEDHVEVDGNYSNILQEKLLPPVSTV